MDVNDLIHPLSQDLVNGLLPHASNRSCFTIANVVFCLSVAGDLMGVSTHINEEKDTERLIAIINTRNNELVVPASLDSFFSPIKDVFLKRLEQLVVEGDMSSTYYNYKAIL